MANGNFFENFEQAFGQKPFTKFDPIAAKRWQQADTKGFDREMKRRAEMAPEDKAEESRNKNMSAHNNTLFVNDDPTKNAGWLDLDEDTLPFKDFGVAQNKEKLYAILDEYDSKNNWKDRMEVIRESWKKFPSASKGVTNWLFNLEDLTNRASDPKEEYPTTAKGISNIMRQITQNVYDSFVHKV